RALRARPARARRLRRNGLVRAEPADALHRPPLLRVPRAGGAFRRAVQRGAARGTRPRRAAGRQPLTRRAELVRGRPAVIVEELVTKRWSSSRMPSTRRRSTLS